jgi:1-acyl-sn-glycerol-3-phosphate acyltransferase
MNPSSSPPNPSSASPPSPSSSSPPSSSSASPPPPDGSSASPPPPETPEPAQATLPPPLSTRQRRIEGYLVRHFHAVRLSRSQRPDLTAARQRPVLVYLNHSSWWDPLICLHLAAQLLPQRRHYAPVEAEALDRYPFLADLGFFSVETESPREARRFLEVATRILEQPDATLWIAPGGRPADPRQRPLKLPVALGHMAVRLRRAVLLPLALEYPFWDEPLPEALARFGEELAVEDAGMRAHDWTEVLAARLEAAQEALAAEALARDAARFEAILGGGGQRAAGAGPGESGGVARLWRRMRALLSAGRRPAPERGSAPPASGGTGGG